MKSAIYTIGVGGNLLLLAMNLGMAVRAFIRDESMLASSIGVTVSALGAWVLVLSRRWAEDMHRRAAAEIEVAERTCDAIRHAKLVAVEEEGVDNARRH